MTQLILTQSPLTHTDKCTVIATSVFLFGCGQWQSGQFFVLYVSIARNLLTRAPNVGLAANQLVPLILTCIGCMSESASSSECEKKLVAMRWTIAEILINNVTCQDSFGVIYGGCKY